MAEERIMIFDVGEQCEYRYPARVNHFDGNGNHTFTDEEIVCHLESQWGEECDDNRCEKCDKKQCIGISRAEAIERIATGFCGGICEKCTDGPNGSEHCIKWLEFRGTMEKAEAALNALFE